MTSSMTVERLLMTSGSDDIGHRDDDDSNYNDYENTTYDDDDDNNDSDFVNNTYDDDHPRL